MKRIIVNDYEEDDDEHARRRLPKPSKTKPAKLDQIKFRNASHCMDIARGMWQAGMHGNNAVSKMEAIQLLRRGTGTYPRDAGMKCVLASYLRQDEPLDDRKIEEILALAEDAYKLNPLNVHCVIAFGKAHDVAAQRKKAFKQDASVHYHKMIEIGLIMTKRLQPKDPKTIPDASRSDRIFWELLANGYLGIQDTASAVEAAWKVLEIKPDSPFFEKIIRCHPPRNDGPKDPGRLDHSKGPS